MRLIPLIMLVLVGTAFSGCIEGIGTMTAKDGLSEAKDAAAALLDETPVLVSVGSLEPFLHYEEADEFEVNIYLDKTPGDGKAPGWAYAFAAGDDMVVIGYSSGLGVVFDMWFADEMADEDLAPITGWKTDSDAAAKALNAHEDWPEPTDSTMVLWALFQGDECPVWSVETVDTETDEMAHGAVDACTGEVLEVARESSTSFRCGSGFSTGSRIVLPVMAANGPRVQMDEVGTISFEVDFGTTIGEVSWELIGPYGTVTQGTRSASDELEDMPAGEYTLEISAETGLSDTQYYLGYNYCDSS